MVESHVHVEVDTLGEEPRWPVVEIQALTSLPQAGHGPVAVNPVYVRLWFHGFQLPVGACRPAYLQGVEQNFWDERVVAFVNAKADRSSAARCQECYDAGRC